MEVDRWALRLVRYSAVGRRHSRYTAGSSGDVGGGGIGSGDVGGRGSASGDVGSSGSGGGGAAAAAAAAAEAKIPNVERCNHHSHFPESGRTTCKGIHSKEKKRKRSIFIYGTRIAT